MTKTQRAAVTGNAESPAITGEESPGAVAGSNEDEDLLDLAREQASRGAKETIGNRLAFASFAIWMVGVAAFYFIIWVPQRTPTGTAAVGAFFVVIVAALPWLGYRQLLRKETLRLMTIEHEKLRNRNESPPE